MQLAQDSCARFSVLPVQRPKEVLSWTLEVDN